MSRTPVRIPTSLNEEDAFLQVGPISLSLRQMITLLASLALWYVVGKFIGGIIGSMTVAMLLGLPIPALGVLMSFKKVAGRPYEEHLADRLAFRISEREYLLTEQRSGASIEEDDDIVL